MTTNISSFERASSNSLYLYIDKEKKINGAGKGIFGRISQWIQGFDKKGNETAKSDFISALKQKYNYIIENNSTIKKLIDDEIKSSKPLSSRNVRQIISIAKKEYLSQKTLELKPDSASVDSLIKKRNSQSTSEGINVISSYKNEDEITSSAARLIESTKTTEGLNTLLKTMTGFINGSSKPEVESKLLLDLKNTPGYKIAKDFAIAFKFNDTRAKITLINERNIKVHDQAELFGRCKMACIAQISTRLEIMYSALKNSKNPDAALNAAKEILEKTSSQIKDLTDTLKLLSDKNFIKDNTKNKAEVALFSLLKTTIETQLPALQDPNGIFQGIIAFSATVAKNPEESYKTYFQA